MVIYILNFHCLLYDFEERVEQRMKGNLERAKGTWWLFLGSAHSHFPNTQKALAQGKFSWLLFGTNAAVGKAAAVNPWQLCNQQEACRKYAHMVLRIENKRLVFGDKKVESVEEYKQGDQH